MSGGWGQHANPSNSFCSYVFSSLEAMMNSALRLLFALLIYLVVARPTIAAEILLADFADERPDFNTASMLVDVRIGNASVNPKLQHTYQFNQPLPPDGTTYNADAPAVTALGACLVNSSCQLSFITSNEFAGVVQVGPDTFFTWTNPPGFTQKLNTYVPQLGPGFTGYEITSISQTINNAALTFENNSYHGNIKQTVRIYGNVLVPEPSTFALCVLTLTALPTRRRKSVAHNRV
jgi:hypothetical protein